MCDGNNKQIRRASGTIPMNGNNINKTKRNGRLSEIVIDNNANVVSVIFQTNIFT